VKYYLMKWSPDSRWLVIIKGFVEDQVPFLFSLANQPMQNFYCTWSFDWHPTQTAFITSVNYSGMSDCGDPDGVFLHLDARKSYWSRHVIYHPISIEDERYFHDAIWSPSGKQILFVQQDSLDGHDVSSRIFIIRPNGSGVRELLRTSGTINSVKWSHNDDEFYYVTEGFIHHYNLKTSDNQSLYLVSKSVEIEDVSPDDRWLIVSVDNAPVEKNDLYLVQVSGNIAKHITQENADNSSQFFVGWDQ
jgi:hypothetical protein